MKSLWKILKVALIALAAILGGVSLLLFGIVFGISLYFGHGWRVVKAAHRQFHPGMTVQQIAAAFPTEYASGSIAVPWRTTACKTASGEISPPEPGYTDFLYTDFPLLPADDVEGNHLKEQAEKFDSEIGDMERLDKHLRERRKWKLVTESWTAYINYFEDPTRSVFLNPSAYLRRGTAYLELGDLPSGYADLSTACKRRVDEACVVLKKMPKDQVKELEAKARHAEEIMAACEPELDWYSLSGPVADERFRLEVNRRGQSSTPKVLVLSRAELAELLAQKFNGRVWIANFMFNSDDFRTFWFYFVVNREGKLKEVTPVTVQD